MTPPILVTGGTGGLGRLVVPRLLDAGREVRIFSRQPDENAFAGADAGRVDYLAGDLVTGEGVDAAVDGVSTVMHLAGSAKGDGDRARGLVAAASQAGVSHLVYISVVGAERVPVVSGTDRAMFGYFESKRDAELVIEESGVPFTTLRATQFHTLSLAAVSGMARLPLIPVPAGIRFQPIDADEVAARLVEIALGQPAGLVADMGGPQAYEMTDLVRSYLHAANRRRPMVRVRMPGRAAAALRAGANLTPHAVGRRTWEEFLAERVAS